MLDLLQWFFFWQIRDAVSSVETRRKFIMALAPHFGRPIEADPVCALYLLTLQLINGWLFLNVWITLIRELVWFPLVYRSFAGGHHSWHLLGCSLFWYIMFSWNPVLGSDFLFFLIALHCISLTWFFRFCSVRSISPSLFSSQSSNQL